MHTYTWTNPHTATVSRQIESFRALSPNELAYIAARDGFSDDVLTITHEQ